MSGIDTGQQFAFLQLGIEYIKFAQERSDRREEIEREGNKEVREFYEAYCQVPEKLNIKIRANKEPLVDHALWHSDRAIAAASPHVAAAGYRN